MRTEDPNFCYLACLEVTNTYAVFTHRGPLSEIGSTYQQIYCAWLPASDYALAGPYDFEAYGPDFDPTDEAKGVLEIWVPVKP